MVCPFADSLHLSGQTHYIWVCDTNVTCNQHYSCIHVSKKADCQSRWSWLKMPKLTLLFQRSLQIISHLSPSDWIRLIWPNCSTVLDHFLTYLSTLLINMSQKMITCRIYVFLICLQVEGSRVHQWTFKTACTMSNCGRPTISNGCVLSEDLRMRMPMSLPMLDSLAVGTSNVKFSHLSVKTPRDSMYCTAASWYTNSLSEHCLRITLHIWPWTTKLRI